MLTTDEANHYWCGRIFRKKVSYAFPEDHNNSQCFVFTKMSGSGSCRIHLQRYEETGKNKKKWDLFSFLLQISKIKRSSLAIHKFNFTIELAF